ncbi:rod shape-determining protein MreC [candidate division WWE3 bacterium]|nr:rod shape-determining protein MreC [candidate division WWE3 bacterium]
MSRVYFFLVFFSLFLISLDRVFPLTGIRSVSQVVLAPVSYGLYQGAARANDSWHFVSTLPHIYSENQSLREQISSLTETAVTIETLQSENNVLKEQLDVKDSVTEQKVLASVIGFSDENQSVVMMLNKGAADGVKDGLVVIVGKSLVGKVTRVTDHVSYVLPPYAVDSRVPAKIIHQNSDVGKGIVRGQFNSRMILTDVLQDINIEKGDIIATSGEGGVYPANLSIGKVSEVSSAENEIFKNAVIEPLWDLKNLKSAFIVLNY